MSRRRAGGHEVRYEIGDYGSLIACDNRMDAFVEALRRLVHEEAIVIDLGAGTGVFALLACRFGAKRVYAIEPSDAITLAQEMAVANGFGERLVCVQEYSTAVELPELADIIVSDLRGMVPFFERHIPTIIDARRRLLAPNGVLIPRRDTVWAALISQADAYEDLVAPWAEDFHGLDMSAARRYVVNDSRTYTFRPEHMASEPQIWAELDYRTIEEPDGKGDLRWTISSKCTLHGVAVWFESELCQGVGYQTGPEHLDGLHRCHWLSFEEPLDVDRGEDVTVRLSARLVEDAYVWRWLTKVTDRSGPGQARIELDQSDFLAVPRSRQSLRRGRSRHRPELNHEGEVDRFVLGAMDGKTSLEEVARRLAKRFPEFQDAHGAALARVARLSSLYSK